MTAQLNDTCIRTHENHSVRIENSEGNIKDLWIGQTELRKSLRSLVVTVIASILGQTAAIILSIWLKQ